MKIILAFDSFKNCLSSPEICRIFKAAVLEFAPEFEVVSVPLGDGGEGTAVAVTDACGGVMHDFEVTGPLQKKVTARWGELPDGSAVFEMASASGIELISSAERNPMKATSFGTGELLRHIICDRKIRKITAGIGGSATVDGGVGMLQALGVRFFDDNGDELPAPADGEDISRICRIDTSALDPEIFECQIKIASDVTNPLCGSNGAAYVFAPQKGASPDTVEFLEKSLENLGSVCVNSKLADNFNSPGDGAAGGVGFALRTILKAKSGSGAELVLDQLKFDEVLDGADFVITGEGRSDAQTLCGKLPAVVAERAGKKGVPVILLSGALGENSEALEERFAAVLSLSQGAVTLQEAIDSAPQNIRRMAKAILNLLCNFGRR